MTRTNEKRDAIHVLRGAKKLIATPQQWTQGALTATYHGRTCYCMVGALRQAASGSVDYRHVRDHPAYMTAYATVIGQLPIMSIPDFNDDTTTTHGDVLAVFDRAIDRLKAS